MWIESKYCRQIISNAWNASSVVGGLKGVMQHISKCSEELAEWNRVSYNSIRRNIASIQGRSDKLLARDPLGLRPKEHKLAHHKVLKWLKREEKLWRQRSRVTWLSEGDKNTCFFTIKLHKVEK